MRALAGFILLAAALTWPLPRHLGTHLTGVIGGDTGVYVWNLWVFQHELATGHWPFRTDAIFAYSGGVDLSSHNYTVFADLLALPWLHTLGVVRTFNLVYLFLIVFTAWGGYRLVRQLVGREAEAWIAGAAFAASPYLIARGTEHFSLAAAAPLPLFVLAVLNTLRTGRVRDAALAGAAMGWAGYCDVYYTIYCGLMGAFLAAHHFWRIERRPDPARHRALVRTLDVLIVTGVILVLWRLWHGEAATVIFGLRVSFRTLYTPMMALTILTLLRAQIVWRPRLQPRAGAMPWPAAARALAVTVAATLLVLTPVVIGLIGRLLAGNFPSPPINWRSSPAGLDLLDFFVPNPNHPWIGGPSLRWIHSRGPLAYPEYVGSLSLAALGLIAFAWRRVGHAIPKVWIAFTAVFALLAMGPFVQVAGVNTDIPGPWWLLRLAPIVGLARSPARFGVVAALGVSILLGFALAAIRREWPRRRRAILWGAAAALTFELLPAPRPLYGAAVPSIYETIRRDTNPHVRVLELPGGVRDGTSSIGDFSASAQFYQTVHEKPLIGGYQSRVSEREKAIILGNPMLAALYRLSENQPIGEALAQQAAGASGEFLARSCLGYVVFTERASAALRQFAISSLDLVPAERAEGRELYVPASREPNAPCAAPLPARP